MVTHYGVLLQVLEIAKMLLATAFICGQPNGLATRPQGGLTPMWDPRARREAIVPALCPLKRPTRGGLRRRRPRRRPRGPAPARRRRGDRPRHAAPMPRRRPGRR